jgi:hypothetical protein
MSTRANVILKEGDEKLIFYRHHDGYPSGTMPTLEKFMQWVKDGKIRNNVQQSGGWLILIGANEYKTTAPKGWEEKFPEDLPQDSRKYYSDSEVRIEPKDWKVGAYEPTTGIHGDIDYLYTIDIGNMKIKIEEVYYDKDPVTDEYKINFVEIEERAY